MKTQYIKFCLIFLGIFFANAQEITGIATYKTHLKIDFPKDSVVKPSAALNDIHASLLKANQKEYALHFSSSESFYKEVAKLTAPTAGSLGIISGMSVGGFDETYKNIKAARYLRETQIMGKEFLIADTLQKKNWVLEKESKTIGEYVCFKATFTEEVTVDKFNSNSSMYDEVKEMRTVEAWYTPQIPVEHGPGLFWGLPGLVLEVADGDTKILCSKIVLNPKKNIEINIPNKGTRITQDEFDKLKKKKLREQLEFAKQH